MDEKIVKGLKKSILFYTIIYALVIVLSKYLLNLCSLAYREWVDMVSLVMIVAGGLIGIVQLILKLNSKACKATLSISLLVILFFISPYALLVVAFSYSPEHVVTKDNSKMVAYVHGFLHTNVEYYEYYNFLIRGSTLRIKEDYGKGGFDPIKNEWGYEYPVESTTYYNEEGEPIINKTEEPVKPKDEITSNTQNVVQSTNSREEKEDYIHFTNEKEGHKIVTVDYAMGKEAIVIYATTDGGKTWISQVENELGGLWVHYDSKFLFLDEKIGFIYDPGRQGDNESLASILVTQNGGKTYTPIEIEHPSNIEEKNLLLGGLPTNENGVLTLKVHTLNSNKVPNREYYEYITQDKGLTWKQNKKLEQ